MAIAANLSVALSLNSARYRRGLDRARSQSRTFANRTRRNIQGVSRAFDTLRNVVIATAAVFGAGAFFRAADDVTRINNLLRASGISASDLASNFELVQQIAQGSRSDLEDVARLFSTLVRLNDRFNLSLNQISVVTQTIVRSFQLTGASTQEAAGATRQLIQALQSGALRGEELNSVLEGAPIIAELIARQLNVSLGELRALSREGRVTSDIVLNALLNGSAQVNEQFAQTNTTFGQLGVQLRNSLLPLITQIAQAVRPAVQLLANLITAFVNNGEAIAAVGAALRLAVVSVVAFTAARVVNGLVALVNAFRTLRVALIGVTTLQAVGVVLQRGLLGLLAGGAAAVAIFAFWDEITTAIGNYVNQLNEALEVQTETFTVRPGENQIVTTVNASTASIMTLTTSLQTAANGLMAFRQTAQTALQSFSQEVGRAVVTGMANFQQLFQSILIQIAAVITQALIATAILAALGLPTGGAAGAGGGVGGFFRSVLGFQSGGRPRAGRPAIVGESGPELIVPDGNSTVVPNGQFDQQPNIGNVTIQVGPGASPAAVRDTISRGFIDQFNNGAIDAGGRPVFRTRRPV